MLNQQADHYRRVAKGPNARKSRVESAQKSQQEAKENVDNQEVTTSTIVDKAMGYLMDLIDK